MARLANKTDPRVLQVCQNVMDLLQNDIDSEWAMTQADRRSVTHAIRSVGEILYGDVCDIIFDCYYNNISDGFFFYGFCITQDGTVYRYGQCQYSPWPPSVPPHHSFQELLMASHRDGVVVGRIASEVLSEQISLIPAAANGELIPSEEGMCDYGTITFLAFQRKGEERHTITLREFGDNMLDNQSPEAKQLAEWLNTYWGPIFPKQASRLPQPTKDDTQTPSAKSLKKSRDALLKEYHNLQESLLQTLDHSKREEIYRKIRAVEELLSTECEQQNEEKNSILTNPLCQVQEYFLY